MKKVAQFYKVMAVCGLSVMMLISSCKKDELESKELLIYVSGEYGSVNNTINVSIVHTPLSVSGTTMISFPVSATHAVPADIDATVSADKALTDKYNLNNGTTYLPLPDANYRIVNSGTHKITAGTLLSDSMQIEILNPAGLTDVKGYLLPLTITGLAGKDKGALISTNQATVYIAIPWVFNNIQASQTPLTGTLASRTAWSVTVSNTTTGALGPAMLDGSNTTAWRSSNSTTAVKWAILNLGSQQSIKGFQIVPNYVTTTENATQMTISTSNDNVNFTVQGVWNGTGPSATSSATSPDIKGVNFLAPVQAQYFRFDITALVSGGRVGIGELNAVQ